MIALTLALALAQAPKGEVTYRVTGLFRQDRVADFREAMKDVPGLKLLAVDYDKAEATFAFVPDKAANYGGRPDQVAAQVNDRVRGATNHTFGVRPKAAPPAKTEAVVIRVAGCKCKACSLAAYEAVYPLPGVERATADFHEGRVTAVIDPTKTDRATLVAALRRREVDVREK